MSINAYSLTLPENRDTAVVFASPHSGREYARTFRGQSVLGEAEIRSSEDAYIEELYASAPAAGAPLLAAIAPRAYIDLNRAANELDPALIKGAGAQRRNPRIACGLGIIPRVVAGGRSIYSGKLSMEEANRRVGSWWRPYHDRLQRLLDESQYYFGQAILIDCHSMPHEALAGAARGVTPAADIVLGDRFGAAAAPHIVEKVESAFSAQGFTVARNTPFAGAFVTEHYGRPARNQHVIQVEIDRSVYMDEATIEPRADFEQVRQRISRAIIDISAVGRQKKQMAAE